MTAFRFLLLWSLVLLSTPLRGDDFSLELRRTVVSQKDPVQLERSLQKAQWNPKETAIIICDSWDLHHCLNAVRRLEEFAPRINELAQTARRRGAIVIHAPSDCMPAYAESPARHRAEQAPLAEKLPVDIAFWCSRIPSEESAVYPIDQSDGGEDDDPKEHAAWAEKLRAMGRNPGTPWKTQSSLIAIDQAHDYITDRGDEVWNILKERGIKNVIMVGVHTNMCVLGRPFGMRQLVRNGIHVALVRDLTDSMYNPKRWPYVDHFTGHDLVITHVERFVAPTITSDQILGGKPLRSQFDRRETLDVISVAVERPKTTQLSREWTVVKYATDLSALTGNTQAELKGPVWYRCAVRIPGGWGEDGLTLRIPIRDEVPRAWLNGTELKLDRKGSDQVTTSIGAKQLVLDDYSILVVRFERLEGQGDISTAPELFGKRVGTNDGVLSLRGKWQVRLGDADGLSNIPLPAKFGMSPEVLFEPARGK